LTRKCTRTVEVLHFSKAIKKGAARVAFTGAVGKTRLKPGTYRMRLVATDAAGNASKTASLTFTVVKA
jgi:hypothetical protein